MQRSVSCRMEGEIVGAADIVLSVAAASGAVLVNESLSVLHNGQPVAVREVADHHGGRLHCASGLGTGTLQVAYSATVQDRMEPFPAHDIDLIRYLRPSRYCESDRLSAFARAEFRGLSGLPLLEAVSAWVGERVAYIAGSSRHTDGAVATLLSLQGVCRDFAHLVVALLRGCDMPARLAAVYAPGLMPMDFHAVAEAYVDGRWLVSDPTGLAPRQTLVRIATGRDAADTAFLSSTGDPAQLTSLDLTMLEVMAVALPDLPVDDLTRPVELG